jgi:hypothetical protein
MSKALWKWSENLMTAAYGVLVRIIGSKPVLDSTTPPVMILVGSSSSAVLLLLDDVLSDDDDDDDDDEDGAGAALLLVFTFTSKRGAPRLIFPVANYLVYLVEIAFRSSEV